MINQACDDSDSDEENWVESEDPEEATKCLFCSLQLPSIEEAITHLKSAHDFDFKKVKSDYSLDFYGYIKVIKYSNQQLATNASFF